MFITDGESFLSFYLYYLYYNNSREMTFVSQLLVISISIIV